VILMCKLGQKTAPPSTCSVHSGNATIQDKIDFSNMFRKLENKVSVVVFVFITFSYSKTFETFHTHDILTYVAPY